MTDVETQQEVADAAATRLGSARAEANSSVQRPQYGFVRGVGKAEP
jgi:hypothetical protein